jgi:WD40 repeat protein
MESDDQPYVGPRQFEREDEKIFFGRKQEASELVSLVIAHGEVLLHAASGAGKSSVVNARLRPLLEREGIEILQPARVQGALKDVDTPNIFVFHTLMSWAENITTDVQRLASLSLKEFLRQHALSFPSGDERSSKPRLMIFDQFEEIFTTCLDRWEERSGFFEQVRDALDDDPLLRALFVMRSDYLGQLDRYAPILPQKLRTRFYLERLRKKAALAAVIEPAKYLGRSFGPGVAESIVMGLLQIQVETAPGKSELRPGEFVEPVQLQIVCQNLWRDLPAGTTEITEQYLTAADVETALLTFYEKSIEEAAQKTGVPEPRLRTWFENELITPAGTRGTVFRGASETAGLSNAAVDVLEQLRLVRSEERGGARWFELTHDRFIDAIKKSRENWWATRAGTAETLKRLKAQAAKLVGADRSKDVLLNPAELLEATRLREGPDATGIEFPPEVVALIERSEMAIIAAQREQELALESAQKVADEQRLRAELEARLAAQYQLQRRIALVRQLVAQTQKYKADKLDLALLLGLEANREADEIAGAAKQDGALSAQEADSLVAEARGGLLSALVASPYLWKFLHGHSGAVRAVAFSPHGTHMITASADGTLIVWNDAGLPVSSPLRVDSGVVWDVAFSPDGLRFASCAHDGTLTFWDVATLQPLGAKLNISEGPLYGIAFSPTEDKLAMCGADGLIRLWNVSRGEQDGPPLQGHQGPVYRLTFSPDGKTLASCGSDHTVIEWDLEKRNVRRQLRQHANEVFSVAFSPDGAILASAGRDNNIILWDESTGEPIGNPLVGHTGSVFSVAFSPNGELLMSGSADKTIRKWDVATREQIGEPPTGHDQRIYSVAFRPGTDTILAAGSASGVTTLWGGDDTRLQLATIVDKGAWILTATYSHNGDLLALGLATGRILLLSTTNWNEHMLEKHPVAVTSIAFSADDSRLVSADTNGTLIIWDTASRMPVGQPLHEHTGQIWTVAASPTGSMIASGGQDGRVILWDITGPTFHSTRMLEHHRGPLMAVAYSPDGRWLASGGLDGTVFLWEMPESESPTLLLNGEIGEVYSLAFSPEGATLAAGGQDGVIFLWDLASRKQSELAEHRDIVRSLVFSLDGQTLASGSEDKTVMLWNVTTRQAIGRLVANGQDTVFGIALRDSGGLLVAGSSKAIFWDVSFDEIRARAGFIAATWLSAKDWERHLGNEPYQIRSSHGLFLLAYWNALFGDTEAARDCFERAVQAAATTNDIDLNNNIAWYGSLHGFAAVVLAAGDRAVDLASKDPRRAIQNYRDSRGIARALSGEFAGAISDFAAFIEYATTKPGREQQVRRRETWIAELKAGRNPLDAAACLTLLREANP